MVIKAYVRKHSHIDHLWRRTNRLGGVIHSTQFQLDGSFAAGTYVAHDIHPHHLNALMGHPAIVVETFGQEPQRLEITEAVKIDVADELVIEEQPKRRGRPAKPQQGE